MPSSIFNALQGAVASQTQFPAPNNNLLSAFMQFKNQFGSVLSARNPAQAVQSILAQRGITPSQFQQIVNQYAAQATEIQKQLMGR